MKWRVVVVAMLVPCFAALLGCSVGAYSPPAPPNPEERWSPAKCATLPLTLGTARLNVQLGMRDGEIADPLLEFERELEEMGQRNLSSEQRRALDELTAASERLRKTTYRQRNSVHRDWERSIERFEIAVCGG